jgi:SAM-dependent methyltransferase
MLDHEYDIMRSVEDGHWWYRVLRQLAIDEIAALVADLPMPRIVDAGCGTGGTLDAIRRRFPAARLAALDVSPLALRHAHERGFTGALEASVDAMPFRDSSLDLAVSLDVLCHQEVDQARAMKEFHRVLVPGGRLIMNLPAFECLRGQHDVAVGTARRYTPSEVHDLHERSGFSVERIFCWNAWLFLPILLWRRLGSVAARVSVNAARSDLALPPAAVNASLRALGSLEAALCRRLRCPVGTSVFSVARSRKTPEQPA